MTYKEALNARNKAIDDLTAEGNDHFFAFSPYTLQLSGVVYNLESLMNELRRIERDIDSAAGRFEAIRALIGVSLAKRDAEYTDAIKSDMEITRMIARGDFKGAAAPPT